MMKKGFLQKLISLLDLIVLMDKCCERTQTRFYW